MPDTFKPGSFFPKESFDIPQEDPERFKQALALAEFICKFKTEEMELIFSKYLKRVIHTPITVRDK